MENINSGKVNQNFRCDITGDTYLEGSFADRVHKYIASTTFEELELRLQGIVNNVKELVAYFEGLTRELFIHTQPRLKEIIIQKNFNPQSVEYTVIYQMWDKIGFYLIQNYPQLAPSILSLYRKFLQAFVISQKLNRRMRIRLHKGGIYHNIGISLLYSNEKEKAKSYFLLGMIEDIINQNTLQDNDFKNAPGYSNLKSLNVFTDENREITQLKGLISGYRNSTNTLGETNPELIFLEFMTNSKNKINLPQFLLWDNVFTKLLIKETDRTTDTQLLGHFLEMLSAYLFFTIGKFEVSCNVKTVHAEHDLRIRNLIVDDPILELLGRYLLVECKNWGNKVNSTRIKKFIANVRFARCSTGILIAKNAITGEKRRDSAWYVIRAEYHKDDIVIIVITMNELNKIADEKTDLLEMLKMKYEKIRFDER